MSDLPPITADDPGKAESASRGRLVLLLTLIALGATLAWVGLKAGLFAPGGTHRGVPSRLKVSQDIPPGGRFRGDPYLGSKGCAECHPGEYALYMGSGHARTFRPIRESGVARGLDGRTVVDPVIPGVEWHFRLDPAGMAIERTEGGELERFVADYAFGSGRHATTFVAIADLEQPSAFEHRLTYYTGPGELGITPGQGGPNPTPLSTSRGRELPRRETFKCFGCHNTRLSARDNATLDPPGMVPNVSCERCHGPGRRHAELARRASATPDELAMPLGTGSWTPESQLEACGKCHQHPDRIPPERFAPGDPVLARFQPIGLLQSRCFQEGGRSMSCVTCHDPHARSSSDAADYERVCLDCHRGSNPVTSLPGSASKAGMATAVACPVSPANGCIGCHMPRVDSGQHILFTDHWIRIVPGLGTRARTADGRRAEPTASAQP